MLGKLCRLEKWCGRPNPVTRSLPRKAAKFRRQYRTLIKRNSHSSKVRG
jgi:hypothetical protein